MDRRAQKIPDKCFQEVFKKIEMNMMKKKRSFLINTIHEITSKVSYPFPIQSNRST